MCWTVRGWRRRHRWARAERRRSPGSARHRGPGTWARSGRLHQRPGPRGARCEPPGRAAARLRRPRGLPGSNRSRLWSSGGGWSSVSVLLARFQRGHEVDLPSLIRRMEAPWVSFASTSQLTGCVLFKRKRTLGSSKRRPYTRGSCSDSGSSPERQEGPEKSEGPVFVMNRSPNVLDRAGGGCVFRSRKRSRRLAHRAGRPENALSSPIRFIEKRHPDPLRA